MCGAAARLVTRAFAFYCRGGDSGGGELKCEVGRELGSGAEAARQAGEGAVRTGRGQDEGKGDG
jgi:hypothetical protein